LPDRNTHMIPTAHAECGLHGPVGRLPLVRPKGDPSQPSMGLWPAHVRVVGLQPNAHPNAHLHNPTDIGRSGGETAKRIVRANDRDGIAIARIASGMRVTGGQSRRVADASCDVHLRR